MARTATWSRTRRFKNALLAAMVRGGVAVLSLLPRRVAGAFGTMLGTVVFVLATRLRRQAIANAGRIDPVRKTTIARRCFASVGRAALEVVSGLRRPASLLSAVRISDLDLARLEEAHGVGRGVVFVSAHIGAWELLAWTFAARGYRVTVAARESYDPRLTRLLRRLRRERGIRPVLRGRRNGASRMLRALRSGGLVGILIDQDTAVPGVFVPFLGSPAWTPRGAAEIALRTGAQVVVGACVRESGSWRVVVRRVPITRRGGDDVRDNTARLTRAVETLVRTWPEQWVWFHARWRTRPSAALEEARQQA